jgi:hypothetical protein
MDFKSIIRQLIIEQDETKLTNWYNSLVKPKEGKSKDGKPKGLVDFDAFKEIIMADPTTKKPEDFDVESATYDDMVNNRVQPGKYANWMLKNFVKPSSEDLEEVGPSDPASPEYKSTITEYKRRYIEDLMGLTEILKDFSKIKSYLPVEKRDINKLTPNGLKLLINDLPQKVKDKLGYMKITKGETAGNEDPRVRFKFPGSEILFVGPNYTLIKIEGTGDAQRKAAEWFGGYYKYNEGESHWCTSIENGNNFGYYAGKGPLYVIMSNDDKGEVGAKTGLPTERYQFHFETSSFMDRMDRQVDLVKLLNGPMEELKDFFKDAFAHGLLSVNKEKAEINYPNSAAGKFVALYGFDELFAALPATLKYLLVSNTSNENIELDIPETLGKFTNVEALLLVKVVKTLPKSIGNMKNLQFLTLSDNKSLKELPEELADLPKLSFLTVRNVPNLVIPPRLAEKLVEEGNGFYYVQ